MNTLPKKPVNPLGIDQNFQNSYYKTLPVPNSLVERNYTQSWRAEEKIVDDQISRSNFLLPLEQIYEKNSLNPLFKINKFPDLDVSAAMKPPPIEKLVISEKAWTPRRFREVTDDPVERKVKSLLNKLTNENFYSISAQILEQIKDIQSENDEKSNTHKVKTVIKLIFEKAIDESQYSQIYARLIISLHHSLLSWDFEIPKTYDQFGKPIKAAIVFKRCLIENCQASFEKGLSNLKDSNGKIISSIHSQNNSTNKELDLVSISEENLDIESEEYNLIQKSKRRWFGLIELIGELFGTKILSGKVINMCFKELLLEQRAKEEKDGKSLKKEKEKFLISEIIIETIFKLAKTIGRGLRRINCSSPEFERHVDNISEIGKKYEKMISSRSKFMIMELIELREKGWE
ncbi:armadillo-type protein [Phakopsora pachyrhizi]|uniref:Armadillo-type protein n=1 Tax=Phakopsora pachyrhizi TaxID=170000 RepID=A0AAV0BPT6_PHAPC|nr:armadillo-type protein [Phakopsora pachyrhizi]